MGSGPGAQRRQGVRSWGIWVHALNGDIDYFVAGAGTSSAAAAAAAIRLADRLKGGTIVTVFPDRGDRYFSKKIYEDV